MVLCIDDEVVFVYVEVVDVGVDLLVCVVFDGEEVVVLDYGVYVVVGVY